VNFTPRMTFDVTRHLVGRMVYLRGAVDAEGEALDVLVQSRFWTLWRTHDMHMSIWRACHIMSA
jgi:hypothetical protein